MVLKQYRAVDRLVHWMEKAAEKENVQSVWTERFFCEYPNLSGVLKVNPTRGENVGCD